MMKHRKSGILLHITSLPSPFGIGDLGPTAYKFADFLSAAGQRLWQVLPLNPTDPAYGNSPYHSISSFSYNPLLISPELLLEDGLLFREDLELSPGFSGERVDYLSVIAYKQMLFQRAYERFLKKEETWEYGQFCLENAYWLDDFALFRALKSNFNGLAWSKWTVGLRERQPDALEAAREDLLETVEMERFLQYLFSRQWASFRSYCNKKGVEIIGDIPIYVVYDSVDVWIHPELFKLDQKKRPYVVAGVPPDYFSKTGQLWGNPVYRWDVLKDRGYDWWVQRIRHNLKLYDSVRIDHFRGFVAYWEVPADEKTALNGQWIEAPATDFFNEIIRRIPVLPIIAEDLGAITPDVREVMDNFRFPGMKVLLFAFGDDLPANPYAPHNHVKNCVVYTGTHDNNTVRGWFEGEAAPEDKERLFRYMGREITREEVHWEFVRLAMGSVADRIILPMQDILGLGGKDRMNLPATKKGNWEWRLKPEHITPSLIARLHEMTEIYGRCE